MKRQDTLSCTALLIIRFSESYRKKISTANGFTCYFVLKWKSIIELFTVISTTKSVKGYKNSWFPLWIIACFPYLGRSNFHVWQFLNGLLRSNVANSSGAVRRREKNLHLWTLSNGGGDNKYDCLWQGLSFVLEIKYVLVCIPIY